MVQPYIRSIIKSVLRPYYNILDIYDYSKDLENYSYILLCEAVEKYNYAISDNFYGYYLTFLRLHLLTSIRKEFKVSYVGKVNESGIFFNQNEIDRMSQGQSLTTFAELANKFFWGEMLEENSTVDQKIIYFFRLLHGGSISQSEVAHLLCTTQSYVSNVENRLKGNIFPDEEPSVQADIIGIVVKAVDSWKNIFELEECLDELKACKITKLTQTVAQSIQYQIKTLREE